MCDDIVFDSCKLIVSFITSHMLTQFICVSLYPYIIGVGAAVVLFNVPSIIQYMANGITPVITSYRAFKVVATELEYPERPISIEGTNITGYINHSASIRVIMVSVTDTNCGGKLCDKQAIKDANIIKDKCACLQALSRNGKPVFVIEVEVQCANGNSYTTEFISSNFMKEYIFIGDLPEGVRAHQFHEFEVENKLYNCISAVFTYINRHGGGFRVIGWSKRGEVLDQGVDQPNSGLPYNASRTMVEAGTLRHHITALNPMNPSGVDLDQLRHLKFNVSTDIYGS